MRPEIFKGPLHSSFAIEVQQSDVMTWLPEVPDFARSWWEGQT